MKKRRNPFAPKKLFHAKNKFKKDFKKSKVEFFYCGNKGYFARECHARKKNEQRLHASTIVEGGEPSQKKLFEEKDYQKEYLI